MTRLERWSLGAILIASCGACAHRSDFPTVTRPDTRQLVGVVFDSAVLRVTIRAYQNAYPNEAAMCYYGTVRDTVMDGETKRFAWADRAIPAAQDSADGYHVWFARGMKSGCIAKGLIGISHAHQAGTGYCTHSVPDAYVLMENHQALFSAVFCANGSLEVLYQDGRRVPDNWLRAFQ